MKPAITPAILMTSPTDNYLRFERDGALLLHPLEGPALAARLRELPGDPADDRRRGGRRNVLDLKEVQDAVDALRPLAAELAASPVDQVRCVRGILFDKTPEANWAVAWHQDRSIAVRERHKVPGYGPWSVKHGIPHVQPPLDVLTQLVTLRLHVDDCPLTNGPLRTLPGTHVNGIHSDDMIAILVDATEDQPHPATAGDILATRPLLLHASSPAELPTRRRVLHLEFSPIELPDPLEFAWSR